MAEVLHLIQSLSRGGAARAMTYLPKYTNRLGDYRHRVAALNRSEAEGIKLASDAGMDVIPGADWNEIRKAIERADLVHVHWWNNPEFNLFFREALPACRLLAWFHVAGDGAPQIVTSKIVNFVDFALACSPHTFLAPGIQALPAALRSKKAGMAYGAADFERLAGLTARPHNGFNVGYIGTVHYLKMHPRFAAMSAAVNVPGIKFVVCGTGDGGRCERDAQATGKGERFDFRGHVEDIRSVIETLDVYGYPLCEDTYAAAEVNLQEVMYAGLPVVVFPHGGVKHLVRHNETGLIVHSEKEYAEAIEFLYHHPAERARLGENAKRYATEVFGAENASREIHRIYQQLLAQPKRYRIWGKDSEQSVLDQKVALADLATTPHAPGWELFLDSLGDDVAVTAFQRTLAELGDDELFAADKKIMEMSELMRSSGVRPYRRYFADDGTLAFWSGLTFQAEGELSQAVVDFIDAIRLGRNHWRVGWYLTQCAVQIGQHDVARSVLAMILQARPNFTPAIELQKKLVSGQNETSTIRN